MFSVLSTDVSTPISAMSVTVVIVFMLSGAKQSTMNIIRQIGVIILLLIRFDNIDKY